MTKIVRADGKSRICILGTRKGEEYMVRARKGGWWITPLKAMRTGKKQREWVGSKTPLSAHLRALAESGLRIEQSDSAKQRPGRCRF
jgi:hypothetical protein